MGAAIAVHEYESFERPGWFERILVLGICAGLLIGLAILDDRAAERETLRAQEVIAERTQRAVERSSREAMTAPAAALVPRTERLGGDSPIVIAAGPSLGPATSVVSEQSVLHRVQGPTTSDTATAIPEPAMAPLQAAPVPAPVAATTARNDEPLLLMLMAALGLSMAGGGLRLLSRRSA